MKVAVPRETAPGERRVALVPESVRRLGGRFEVAVEAGQASRRASRTTSTRRRARRSPRGEL